MNKLVYIHKRATGPKAGEVFYVGIGSEKRAYSTAGRNDYWHRIVKKYGYKIEIVYDHLSWKQACEIEIELIAKYGRSSNGGILCNLTSGGEGTLGLEHSAETRRKLSEANTKTRYTITKNDGTTFYGTSNEIDSKFGIARKTVENRSQQLGRTEMTIEELMPKITYYTIIKADGITFYGSKYKIADEFSINNMTVENRAKQLSKTTFTLEELFGTKPAGVRKMNKYLASA